MTHFAASAELIRPTGNSRLPHHVPIFKNGRSIANSSSHLSALLWEGFSKSERQCCRSFRWNLHASWAYTKKVIPANHFWMAWQSRQESPALPTQQIACVGLKERKFTRPSEGKTRPCNEFSLQMQESGQSCLSNTSCLCASVSKYPSFLPMRFGFELLPLRELIYADATQDTENGSPERPSAAKKIKKCKLAQSDNDPHHPHHYLCLILFGACTLCTIACFAANSEDLSSWLADIWEGWCNCEGLSQSRSILSLRPLKHEEHSSISLNLHHHCTSQHRHALSH